VNAVALGDDDEGALVVVVGVDVADRGVGELERKVAEPPRQVAS
jgi:hypothetical protein